MAERHDQALSPPGPQRKGGRIKGFQSYVRSHHDRAILRAAAPRRPRDNKFYDIQMIFSHNPLIGANYFNVTWLNHPDIRQVVVHTTRKIVSGACT
jgi:hypothetical protein